MVVTCDIQFENNPEATFYAGQVITGKITLTADKIKQVKAVTLKISGAAKTRWTEKSSTTSTNNNSSTSSSSDTTYWGQVDYMNTLTSLLTPNATDQAVIIEPGIHTFSFACHIPANCPSSFESFRGNIRYIIQVALVRPWKFDQTFTRPFTVLSIKNLNYDTPLLKLPITSDISKIFCCGPCKSDPLQINVHLPQTGFVPGQLIPVNILVTNETSARINEICVRLVMIITLFSTHPTRRSNTERKTVSKLIGDPVLRHSKKQFNYLLPIPATPPTCSTLCNIIQIAYHIEVEAKMQGMLYTNQCIQLPVTIGNVPLQMDGMVVQQQPMRRQIGYESNGMAAAENNNDASTSNRNMEPWSTIGNIPPPVYMPATHMSEAKLSEDSAHDYGEKNFSPKYPVFNIPSPTSPLPCTADETDGPAVPPTVTDPDKTTWL
ncbi:arrestin domain-containing protein 17-like isoform X1 [Lucilia sericata]|uniref:arrestin domain-containing protein 17-like isoform X1 n=1 Tax=Lucilia sericata TaxID=13632 RepID=UPI0018A85E62|nr:arrestin domain-containing protein 17-like isoform X1 [Lucilia sericata]